MDELVKELRLTERVCRDRMDGQVMLDAADAIERLTAEVDRKEKAIERMRDLMEHYKAAYRTAYKLYQEALHGN